MALRHRQITSSKLGRPAVVGPIVFTTTVKVNLASELTRRTLPPQMRTMYKLRPPTQTRRLISPTGNFLGTSNISASLTMTKAVGGTITATSGFTAAVSLATPPAVDVPIIPPTITTSLTNRRMAANSRLLPPKYIAAVTILPPARTKLAVITVRHQHAQRRVKSFLRRPLSSQSPVIPVATLIAASDVSATVTILRGVTPAAINATSNVNLTGSLSTTGSPQPIQANVETFFATKRHAAQSKLKPPAFINAPAAVDVAVTAGVSVTLNAVRTRQEMRRRVVQAKLSPPEVVGAPVVPSPLDFGEVTVKIARQPRRLPARIAFIYPAVINPIVLSGAQKEINTTLTAVRDRQARRYRVPQSKLRPPVQIPAVTTIPSASITSTSTVSATVNLIGALTGGDINSTSTITASVVRLVPITGSLIATSDMAARVTGGSGPTTFVYQSSPIPAILYVMNKGGPLGS